MPCAVNKADKPGIAPDGFGHEQNDKLQKLEHPVIPVGELGTWDCLGISEPTIVWDGREYRCYYEGLGTQDKSWRIGYATSQDFVHWTKSPHNPVLEPNPALPWADRDVLEPFILKDERGYHLWYTANLCGTAERNEIGYAASPDGIHWEMYPQPSISFELLAEADYTGASEPAVIKRPGFNDWIMYFQAWRAGRSHVGYALSRDGVHWRIPAEFNPVIESGVDGEWHAKGAAGPDVVLYQGWYYLYYNSWRSPGGESIGLAVSRDALSYYQMPGNPVIRPSANPAHWDRHSVYEPGLRARADGSLAILFGGFHTWNGKYDEETKLQIGLALGRLPRIPESIAKAAAAI